LHAWRYRRSTEIPRIDGNEQFRLQAARQRMLMDGMDVPSAYDINRKAPRSSSLPRHREVNDFLARKICDDLLVSRP